MVSVMMNILKDKGISLNKVSKKSGVALTTLTSAIHKPIESWSLRVLFAFAKGVNMNPSKLLETIQPPTYTLEINDKEQKIQGVYIADKDNFYAIRTAVEVEHLEGWNPTKEDIEYLLKSANNPNPQLEKEYNEIFGKNNE